jgi:outer membrane lipoprotein SlyB
MKNSLILLTFLCVLAGCANQSLSGETYSRHQARQTMKVHEAEVLLVAAVTIDGTTSRIGRIGGAGIGYTTGRTIGDGDGRRVAGAVGAVAGAVAGEAIEKKITEKPGYEIHVELQNGDIIAIVQAADVEFYPGERVHVLLGRGGAARVVKRRI